MLHVHLISLTNSISKSGANYKHWFKVPTLGGLWIYKIEAGNGAWKYETKKQGKAQNMPSMAMDFIYTGEFSPDYCSERN